MGGGKRRGASWNGDNLGDIIARRNLINYFIPGTACLHLLTYFEVHFFFGTYDG